MATVIKTLTDGDGNIVLPRTRIEAVTYPDGSTTLEDKFGEIEYDLTAIQMSMIKKSTSPGSNFVFMWVGTQAQYDAISVKDATTFYAII